MRLVRVGDGGGVVGYYCAQFGIVGFGVGLEDQGGSVTEGWRGISLIASLWLGMSRLVYLRWHIAR